MKKISTVLALQFVLVFSHAHAAGDSNSAAAASTRARETLKYYNLEKSAAEKEEQVRSADEAVEAIAPEKVSKLPGGGQKIFVKEIEVPLSKLLSNKEVIEAVLDYEGKELSISDLNELVARINKLYRESGQITAKAYLPPQKITDGKIEIKLVEGTVGKIEIEGNTTTKDSYIRRNLAIYDGEIVDMKLLEKRLFLFNRKSDISLRAVLRPGEATGTTDYVLKVKEPRKIDILMYTDNAGRDETGRERFGMVITNKSLLGLRDQFSFGGLLADGTKNGFTSYNIPINRWGTRAGISYDYSRTSVRSGPMKHLKVTGKSKDLGFVLSHPLLVNKTYGLNVFAGYNNKRSSTAYDAFTVLAQKLRTFSYGFDYSNFGERLSWEFRNYGTRGLRHRNGDAEFFKYNSEVNAFFQISPKTFAMFRSNMQYSDSSEIPSSEQFQVGGVASVRGYPEGHMIGDKGYFMSLELSRKFLGSEKTRIVYFIDHGGIMNQKSSNVSDAENDSITSLGIGFNVNFTKQLSGRIYCGVPMLDHNEEAAYQPVIHFDVQLRF